MSCEAKCLASFHLIGHLTYIPLTLLFRSTPYPRLIIPDLDLLTTSRLPCSQDLGSLRSVRKAQRQYRTPFESHIRLSRDMQWPITRSPLGAVRRPINSTMRTSSPRDSGASAVIRSTYRPLFRVRSTPQYGYITSIALQLRG